MATSEAGLTVVDQVVQDLKAKETVAQKKANTVTTAIGSVATIAAAGLSALVESGTDLPSWFPFLVVVVGMIATTYGVSKTKNGVTQSIADKLHDEIAARIDANHFHDEEYDDSPTQAIEIDNPNVQVRETDPAELLRIAESMSRPTR
ncbi:holin [Gordonia phage Secretariat]|uniref:Holin n=1 Tax=Gordonia phage Secretariat TaxID=2725616 RepID=A0A6M3SWT3_9CAUD|nr:holin [Gordonia phage Secretariat]QJD49588.1 holin [Gordonia phage Secretariat]